MTHWWTTAAPYTQDSQGNDLWLFSVRYTLPDGRTLDLQIPARSEADARYQLYHAMFGEISVVVGQTQAVEWCLN